MNDVPVENLTLNTFAPLVNARFKVQASPTQAVELNLASASELKSYGTGGKSESFSLLFTGPEKQFLSQGNYTFESENIGRFILFMVPVGPLSGLMQYEVLFNRVPRAA
jgi:hypothetical protein